MVAKTIKPAYPKYPADVFTPPLFTKTNPAAPIKPTKTPNKALLFNLRPNKSIPTITVKRGTREFKIPANPVSISFSEIANKKAGIPFPKTPTTAIGQKSSVLSLEKCLIATGNRTKPAKTRRKLPRAKGEYNGAPLESFNTKDININELPHIKAKTESTIAFFKSLLTQLL